jgi:NitT/TauT family transport system substrate-binding protein
MRRALAGPVLAIALVATVAGCSSGAPRARLGSVQTGAGGDAGLAASPAHASGAVPVLRLGLTTGVADGIALVGLQEELFRADLGAAVTLDAVPFASSGAEQAALADGRLDAAYLVPVAAVGAWQSARGGIRIIAGAAAAGGRASVVLAVSARYLAAHPGAVVGLLKGQVQAGEMLNTDQTSAQAALGAELAALGQPVGARQLARSFAQVTFTNDPLAASIAAQAQQAAAAGSLKPVTALGAIYDVGPLNKLLRAAGLKPVTA